MKARTPKQERHRIMREMDARSRLYAKLSRERDQMAQRLSSAEDQIQWARQEYQGATGPRVKAAIADRIKRLTSLADRMRNTLTDTQAEMNRVGSVRPSV